MEGFDILSLLQRRGAVDTLVSIARGYRINSSGNRQRLDRTRAIDMARAWLADNGISWQEGR
jgi:hypothetical protein